MWFDLLLLSLGLAADAALAAAVVGASSSTKGATMRGMGVALVFGAAQALMPLLSAGALTVAPEVVRLTVQSFAHWLAFAVLGGLGLKTMRSSSEEAVASVAWTSIVSMAVATSLDAFFVGPILQPVYGSLLGPAALIGGVTALCSVVLFAVGKRLSRFDSRHINQAAGAVLMLLGVKILLEGWL